MSWLIKARKPTCHGSSWETHKKAPQTGGLISHCVNCAWQEQSRSAIGEQAKPEFEKLFLSGQQSQVQILSGTDSIYIDQKIPALPEVCNFHCWITILCTQTYGPCPPDPTRNSYIASVRAGLQGWAGGISRFGIASFCPMTPPFCSPSGTYRSTSFPSTCVQRGNSH